MSGSQQSYNQLDGSFALADRAVDHRYLCQY